MDLGRYNTLKIDRFTGVGAFLEDSDGEQVLLPQKWVPQDAKVGDKIEVFVYLDGEEREIATTMKPKAEVRDFAYLQVKQTTKIGAFLDWGLEKDVLVPFDEQKNRMQAGHSYVVYLYIDDVTGRITASTKLAKFADNKSCELEPGDEVDLLVASHTQMGYNVIINNRYIGLIYENEVFKNIKNGDQIKGYIKMIRDDYKIDVSLEKAGYGKVDDHTEIILRKLEENEGFLDLNDKSDPSEIALRLQMSKKTYKKAIGNLYKARKIKIEDNGISLIK